MRESCTDSFDPSVYRSNQHQYSHFQLLLVAMLLKKVPLCEISLYAVWLSTHKNAFDLSETDNY